MRLKNISSLIIAAGIAQASLPLAAPAFAAPPAPSQEGPAASIDGFRSAHFGMDEAQVRGAIATDFRLSSTAIHAAQNPVQRTDVFGITVPNLITGAGKATVDYIFGYQSHKLTEVNIAWTTSGDPANAAQALVHTGTVLQSYFEGEGFPAGKSAADAFLPGGAILLFRGTDAAGHAVVLTLAGPLHKDAQDATKGHQLTMTPAALTLAYAQDPTHPDVFQPPKGAF
jgi:hypothetical protein